MTLRLEEYRTRDDDKGLNETLEAMKNVRNTFDSCTFAWITTKNFVNCHFLNCTFENVGSSMFTNCVFENPKFYEGFRGKFVNCSLSGFTGYFGERKPEQ